MVSSKELIAGENMITGKMFNNGGDPQVNLLGDPVLSLIPQSQHSKGFEE